MKKLRTITIIAIVFCAVVLLMTMLDYLALHDIRQDYLSRHIIGYLGLSFTGELPAWTTTTGEWRIVGISLVVRTIFVLFMFVVLFGVLKWQRDSKSSA